MLRILVHIYCCQSFKLERFSGCVVYLIVVLICISLVTNNAEHLFMCLLAICVCSFVKYLFYPFENKMLFLLIIELQKSVCILVASSLSDTCHANISPGLWLAI